MNDAFVAPLLGFTISTEADDDGGDRGNHGEGSNRDAIVGSMNNCNSSGTVVGGTTSLETSSSSSVACTRGQLPNSRAKAFWSLRFPALADKLPTPLFVTVTNGKIAALALAATYLTFLMLWFPFWLLSFLVGEIGIYGMAVFTVFFVGRNIIRLIAFPGASQKVATEIETEFSKYSVRMIALSCECLIDVATVIAQSSPTTSGATTGDAPLRRRHSSLYDMPLYWRRAKTYRDRVLGVYAQVLGHLYHHQPSGIQANEHVPGASSSVVCPFDTTKFGNNVLHHEDDIGDLSDLTPQARSDGHDLWTRLQAVLQLLDDLEHHARPVLEAGLGPKTPNPLTVEAGSVARRLIQVATELRDFVGSLRRQGSDTGLRQPESPTPAGHLPEQNDSFGMVLGTEAEDEESAAEVARRRFEDSSQLNAVKAGLSSVLKLLDPPPHTSIFGLDVLRGCVLSRYRGSRQFWVSRPQGGKIDVLYFAARLNSPSVAASRNVKAVLYCNPNAGLTEVATGLSLAGGNICSTDSELHASLNSQENSSWTDFYTNEGFDVYVFNYAGYGRSFGTTCFVSSVKPGDKNYYPGCSARMMRIFKSAFLSFSPAPATLRADGIAVALHLINNLGVKKLIVHGESIGGIAAAGVGRYLSSQASDDALGDRVALLICDRTFCNLEAVAQRLVGRWSGYAIRALAPLWNTDVAGDFAATKVPKVVASDAADCIIDDAASLKAGIALWKELHCGVRNMTKDIAWIVEAPLHYRMADWENACVNDSKYVNGHRLWPVSSPLWPADRRVAIEEAFHFAACCTRIWKLTKKLCNKLRENGRYDNLSDSDKRPNSVACSNRVSEAWKVLASCDGLTGAPLGVATKQGFDAIVSWLCSLLAYGGQILAGRSAPGNPSFEHHVESGVQESTGGNQEPHLPSKSLPEVVYQITLLLEAGDESLAPRKLPSTFKFFNPISDYVALTLLALSVA